MLKIKLCAQDRFMSQSHKYYSMAQILFCASILGVKSPQSSAPQSARVWNKLDNPYSTRIHLALLISFSRQKMQVVLVCLILWLRDAHKYLKQE